ncbi:MAG: ATP synthase F1 subunit epsilon [Phycisphaeraceae bacterium]|nr:ATP synthase F1 subunit epsilon [Phycisphaeraceae bacterium]
MATSFQCTLVTPERQLVDQQVKYASVPAWDGLLGVEPQRAPLMIKLGAGALRLDDESGQSQIYFVSGGFAQMKDNKLSLIADAALPADQIDKAAAQAELNAALEEKAVGEEAIALKKSKVQAARAKLHIAG